LLGRLLVTYVQAVDHWIAFGLLVAIGLKMVIEALREKEEIDCRPGDPTRGWSLIGLALATSIDALGAGLGLAMVLETQRLLLAAMIIGIICSSVTYTGMRVGAFIGRLLGRRMEAFGGVVLIALGVRMLWI
jgi:putative Mn2+ efflux pump MntP